MILTKIRSHLLGEGFTGTNTKSKVAQAIWKTLVGCIPSSEPTQEGNIKLAKIRITSLRFVRPDLAWENEFQLPKRGLSPTVANIKEEESALTIAVKKIITGKMEN